MTYEEYMRAHGWGFAMWYLSMDKPQVRYPALPNAFNSEMLLTTFNCIYRRWDG